MQGIARRALFCPSASGVRFSRLSGPPPLRSLHLLFHYNHNPSFYPCILTLSRFAGLQDLNSSTLKRIALGHFSQRAFIGSHNNLLVRARFYASAKASTAKAAATAKKASAAKPKVTTPKAATKAKVAGSTTAKRVSSKSKTAVEPEEETKKVTKATKTPKKTASAAIAKDVSEATSPSKAPSKTTKRTSKVSPTSETAVETPVKASKTTKKTQEVSIADSEPKKAKRSASPSKKDTTKMLKSNIASKKMTVIELDPEDEIQNFSPPKPRGRPKKVVVDLTDDSEVAVPKAKSKKASSAKTSASKQVKDDDDQSIEKSSGLRAKMSSASRIYGDAVMDIDEPITTATKKRGRPKSTTSSEVQKPSDSLDDFEPATKKKAKRTTSKATSSSASLSSESSDVKEVKERAKPTRATKLSSDTSVLPEGDEFIINDQAINYISREMGRDFASVRNTMHLLRDGNTVPFITRYRKEMIGEMDETHVRNIHKLALQYTALQQRKLTVLETMKTKFPEQLTPELEREIIETTSMRHLEDLYAPYRPKKNSLADVAISKGLAEIAEKLLKHAHSDKELKQELSKLIDPAKSLNNIADVALGIQHIWAEKISDSVNVRNAIRPIYAEFGTLAVSENTSRTSEDSGSRGGRATKGGATKGKDETGHKKDIPSRKRADTYAYYFNFSKPISALRSHNVMAINRGEREKFLKVKFSAPDPDIVAAITETFAKDQKNIYSLFQLILADLTSTPEIPGSSTSVGRITPNNILATLVSSAPKPKKLKLDEEEEEYELTEEDDEYWDATATSQHSKAKTNLKSHGQSNNTIFGDRSSVANAGEFSSHCALLRDSILDSFKRLLHPSMSNEARSSVTEAAEADSIATFGRNLKALLLKSPVSGHIILGLDPGYTHGCKTCIIDENGKVLETRVIFPFAGESKIMDKLREFDSMIRRHNVSLVAIGNGTAHRETVDFVKRYKKEANSELLWCLVDESGASVYSVSPEAQAELPHLDPAGRGAASIARRTLDPMAEIVKIPTQSIGVGSYQHDVNQKELERSLSSVVEDCVNYVGVNLNTASQPLLRRVSGLTSVQAQNIVAWRDTNGGFKSRDQLLGVKGVGPKTYTQCAGFLRIPDSTEPLDNTGIHPESYRQAAALLKSLNFAKKDIIVTSSSSLDASPDSKGSKLTKRQKLEQALDKVDLQIVAKDLGLGLPTLSDMIEDLKKPGRDPRATAEIVQLDNQIATFSELKVGMSLLGRVVNVTGFGAFVDVGIEHSGLVIPKDIIDPKTNLPVNAANLTITPGYVGTFEVLSVDMERRRYGLRLFLNKEGSKTLM